MIQTDRVRVVDPEMNDVPADGTTLGEIVMRGNNVMLGYYLDEEGTRTAFAGGWFHSGTWGSCTRTGTSSCATAPRTS